MGRPLPESTGPPGPDLVVDENECSFCYFLCSGCLTNIQCFDSFQIMEKGPLDEERLIFAMRHPPYLEPSELLFVGHTEAVCLLSARSPGFGVEVK